MSKKPTCREKLTPSWHSVFLVSLMDCWWSQWQNETQYKLSVPLLNSNIYICIYIYIYIFSSNCFHCLPRPFSPGDIACRRWLQDDPCKNMSRPSSRWRVTDCTCACVTQNTFLKDKSSIPTPIPPISIPKINSKPTKQRQSHSCMRLKWSDISLSFFGSTSFFFQGI